MQVRVYNGKSLDERGTKARIIASISHDKEAELLLTKEEYDSLGEKVISKIRSVEANGYFVLKVARILKGLRQSDMAKMLGISLKAYQRREMGRSRGFTFLEALTICEEFKISVNTLFFTSKYLNIA